MADSDRPPETRQDWSAASPPPGSLPFEPEPLPPLPAKWSAPLADAPAEGVWKRFDQIKIGCTTTMCEADLHCFRLTQKLARTLSPGSCRECGKLLVSLQRTAARDLSDVDATFVALQRECVRHYFWHVPWGQKALDYARRAGRIELEARIERRVRSRIGKAQHPAEGRQTPIARDRADALDFALHAVAACCRKCANYWHGIPIGRPLADEEVNYLTELVRAYTRARLPHLADAPMTVPRRQTTALEHLIPKQERATVQQQTAARRSRSLGSAARSSINLGGSGFQRLEEQAAQVHRSAHQSKQ